MHRRTFLQHGCALCALAWGGHASAAGTSFVMPQRFSRPDSASDEGGIWAMMDREEKRLRKSEFVIRDKALQEYVEGICCRLAGSFCPDIRVYVMRTPLFNASMYPNGMMQVWSGLLLRCQNESQVAAVIGHEIAHYLQRHSLERLRDVKSKTAFMSVLSVFGLAGALVSLGVAATAMAFSRDQEREADSVGAHLMKEAGFDLAEAPKIWANLQDEFKAGGVDNSSGSILFASHPPTDERRDFLAGFAATSPSTSPARDQHGVAVAGQLETWLADEIKRGQHEQSLALLTRFVDSQTHGAAALAYRGELYRALAGTNEADNKKATNARGDVVAVPTGSAAAERALADYASAATMPNAPALVHRGQGYLLKERGDTAGARAAFETYLNRLPLPADAGLIKSYLEELPK
jgi:predicted Zn-dependent protease